MNLEIANRLVQLRKEHHLSQEELAEKIGISRQAVSKWERAESSPDTDNLILLSKLYHISIDELLRTSDEEDPIVSPCRQELTIDNNDSPSTDVKNTHKHTENAMSQFPYPVLVTIIYLAIGLIFNKWHPGWLVFLTIPIYYWIAEIIYPKQKE